MNFDNQHTVETVIMMPLKFFVCSLLSSGALAFIGNNDWQRRCESRPASSLELQMTTGHVSRRSLLAGMTAAAPAFLLSQQAQAKDEIFKPNPLTNPVLEQVRFVLLAFVL
jgi:hypothetical protein